MAENNWCVARCRRGGRRREKEGAIPSVKRSDRIIEIASFRSVELETINTCVSYRRGNFAICKITNDKLFLKVEETED